METVENKYITVAYKLYAIEVVKKISPKKPPQNTLSNSFPVWV